MKYLLLFYCICLHYLYCAYGSVTMGPADANSMIRTVWVLMAATGIAAVLSWFFSLFVGEEKGNGNP